MSQFQSINWEQVWKKIEAAHTSCGERMAPSEEETKRILHTRALALACEPVAKDPARVEFEILEFDLAHERYALETQYVREVQPLKEFTPVPGTPPFILGIINIRGQIVSVTDLKTFFGLPRGAPTKQNKIILIHNDRVEFAILVDAVIGSRWIDQAGIQALPAGLGGQHSAYLHGVGHGPVMVLNGEALLNDPTLIVQDEIDTKNGGHA